MIFFGGRENLTPKAQAIKAKINKDYIKLKILCTAKKKKNQQNEKETYRMG